MNYSRQFWDEDMSRQQQTGVYITSASKSQKVVATPYRPNTSAYARPVYASKSTFQPARSTKADAEPKIVNATTCTHGAQDCAGVCGGKSVKDCAGNCYDPTKTAPPVIKDCAGVCGGKSELDCAGNCYDPTKGGPPVIKDCAGVCGGSSVPDCAGVCGGKSVPDCNGTCGGSAVADCAGVCGGHSIKDCAGNCYNPTTSHPPVDRDCAGVCGGQGYYDCTGTCVTPNCTWDGRPYATNAAYAHSDQPYSCRKPDAQELTNNFRRKVSQSRPKTQQTNKCQSAANKQSVTVHYGNYAVQATGYTRNIAQTRNVQDKKQKVFITKINNKETTKEVKASRQRFLAKNN